MEETIQQKVKTIKQSFRLLMNGITAQSMREKDTTSLLNWGASIIHLREMASEITPDKALAQELWLQNVRECKLLATMLMPPAEMTAEMANEWLEDDRNTQEIVEQLAFNLLQHVHGITPQAMQWIMRTSILHQIAGYTLLGRLFMKGLSLTNAEAQQFQQAVQQVMSSGNLRLMHAANNALLKSAGE